VDWLSGLVAENRVGSSSRVISPGPEVERLLSWPFGVVVDFRQFPDLPVAGLFPRSMGRVEGQTG
jgi:hypothetical protein